MRRGILRLGGLIAALGLGLWGTDAEATSPEHLPSPDFELSPASTTETRPGSRLDTTIRYYEDGSASSVSVDSAGGLGPTIKVEVQRDGTVIRTVSRHDGAPTVTTRTTASGEVLVRTGTGRFEPAPGKVRQGDTPSTTTTTYPDGTKVVRTGNTTTVTYRNGIETTREPNEAGGTTTTSSYPNGRGQVHRTDGDGDTLSHTAIRPNPDGSTTRATTTANGDTTTTTTRTTTTPSRRDGKDWQTVTEETSTQLPDGSTTTVVRRTSNAVPPEEDDNGGLGEVGDDAFDDGVPWAAPGASVTTTTTTKDPKGRTTTTTTEVHEAENGSFRPRWRVVTGPDGVTRTVPLDRDGSEIADTPPTSHETEVASPPTGDPAATSERVRRNTGPRILHQMPRPRGRQPDHRPARDHGH